MPLRGGVCCELLGLRIGPSTCSWIAPTRATKRASWHWTLGFIPVVPPKKTRIEPWEYDLAMYKRRNEVERLFRRIKAYRRIFTRYDKLDVVYATFVSMALICEHLR